MASRWVMLSPSSSFRTAVSLEMLFSCLEAEAGLNLGLVRPSKIY